MYNTITHNMKTSTGYKIQVFVVSPTIFQELRSKYNIDRKPFMYKFTSPETGAELNFVYEPPVTEPNKEEDPRGWEDYKTYQAWVTDYNHDVAEYTKNRNRLLLVSAVKVIRKITRGTVQRELTTGEWRKRVEAGGLEITPTNEMYLFLKSEVLANETDYLKVLDLATAEEVGMGDVLSAFDYFRTVLARCPNISNPSEVARRGEQFLSAILGKPNGFEDEDESKPVVHDIKQE